MMFSAVVCLPSLAVAAPFNGCSKRHFGIFGIDSFLILRGGKARFSRSVVARRGLSMYRQGEQPDLAPLPGLEPASPVAARAICPNRVCYACPRGL